MTVSQLVLTFASDWLKVWCGFSSLIVKLSEGKTIQSQSSLNFFKNCSVLACSHFRLVNHWCSAQNHRRREESSRMPTRNKTKRKRNWNIFLHKTLNSCRLLEICFLQKKKIFVCIEPTGTRNKTKSNEFEIICHWLWFKSNFCKLYIHACEMFNKHQANLWSYRTITKFLR